MTSEGLEKHIHEKFFSRPPSRSVIRHKHEWQKIETSIALLNEICRCGATREILN